MSTTPRTDEIERAVPESAHICDHWHAMDQHARQLENELGHVKARLFQADSFARSFLAWAAQMRSVGRTLPGMEARENEARGALTKAEGEA